MAISRIAIEWQPILDFPGGFGHLYLVGRETGQSDDQGYAISGYPEGESTGTPEYLGTQRLEVNKSHADGSFSALNGGYGRTLANTHDAYNVSEVEADRDSLDLTSAIIALYGPMVDLGDIWKEMVQFAQQLNDAQYTYDLETGRAYMVNSNSIAASVLSKIGIDAAAVFPATPAGGFPGADTILSGSGGDVLQAFNGDDFIFDRGGGHDGFYGGSYATMARHNDADGFDTLQYDGASESGLIVHDNYREADDGAGGTDLLYSIEKVRFVDFDAEHTLDYGDFGQGIKIDSYSLSEHFVENGDLLEHGGDYKTGVKIDEGGGAVFEAVNFGTFITTAYADTVRMRGWGVTEAVTISTGAGNDVVDVTVTGAEIDAGSGDDRVRADGYGSIVYTGDGADRVQTGNNLYVADASVDDRILFFGDVLSGAGRNLASDSAWTTWSGAVRFSRNVNGDLVIQDILGRETFVANYTNTLDGAAGNTAGIFIYNMDVGVYRLGAFLHGAPSIMNNFVAMDAQLKAALGDQYGGYFDPLVIDLDGDGLEIRGETPLSPHFDMNGDGFAERAGWAGPDDGFIARDLNANGSIDDIGELFGAPGTDGYTALAALDENLDGKIDSGDAAFSSLRIWRDADQDGETDSGELKTLAEWDIASINVTPDDTNVQVFGKYHITATGSYTRTDTSTGTTGNLLFRNNMHDTEWLTDIALTPETLALPEVAGRGTLPGLRAAMSYDPALETIVGNNLANLDTPNLAALRAAVMPILNGWRDAVDMPPGEPGTLARIDVPVLVAVSVENGAQVLDYGIKRTDGSGDYWVLASGEDVLDAAGQEIARPTYADIVAQAPVHAEGQGNWDVLSADMISFMERWTGMQLPIGMDTPDGGGALDAMKDVIDFAWQEVNHIAISIAAQDTDALGGFFAGLAYNAETHKFEATTDGQLAPMLEEIFDAAPGNPAGDLDYIQGWKGLLTVVIENFDRGGDSLLNSSSFLFQNIVAAYENVGVTANIVDVAGVLSIDEDLVRTGAGNMIGGSDADIFYMDGGNQTAYGKDGPDSYVFGENFGQDTVIDIDPTLGTDLHDTVRFAHYNTGDMTAVREGNDLILTVTGTSHSVRIVDQFAARPKGLTTSYLDAARGVSEIVFADGTVWDRVDMAYAVSDPQAGNQTITGTGQVDVLDGGAGDDILRGGNQSDVYIFGAGYGNDIIADDYEEKHDVLLADFDILKFKDGITLDDVVFVRDGNSDNLTIEVIGTSDSITIEKQFKHNYSLIGDFWLDKVEGIVFDDGMSMGWQDLMTFLPEYFKTDGNDDIHGFDVEDVLDGGAGDDFLSGGNENDTYIFGAGYGHDTIQDQRDSVFSGATDRIIFRDNVSPGDVTLSRVEDSDDLVLTLTDGSTLTVIDQFKIINTIIAGVQSWDRIEFFEFQDVGNTVWDHEDIMDMLIVQASTSGDDDIYGFTREDILDGGAGNDYLAGGYEGDTYHFGRGYGHDVIFDESSSSPIGTDIDKLIFTSDVMPSDIRIEAGPGGWDFVLTIVDTGETVTLTKQNHRYVLGQPYFEIEEVRFADTTVWTPDDMREKYLSEIATSGNDTIYGFWTADVIDGGAGNDRMEGGGGGDTYLFGIGSGNDVIYDYITKITWAGDDTVLFTGSLVQADVDFTKSGNSLIVSIIGQSDTLEIEDFYTDSGVKWIERFEFSDASVLSYSDVYTMTVGADLIEGTAGNNNLDGTAGHDRIYGLAGDDSIRGFEGNDVLDGGAGNDEIEGWSGDDDYIAGPGDDVIEDTSGTLDEIVFGPNIALSDLVIYRQHAFPYNHLVIEWNGGDSITIFDHFNNASSSNQVEQLRFDDNSTYNLVNRSFVTKGTSGNNTILGIGTNTDGFGVDDMLYGLEGDDTISGKEGNDIIDGGTGNDLLKGEAGDDDYIASAGVDIIEETGSGFDEILLGGSITSEDIEIFRATGTGGYMGLFITWGTSDSIEVKDFFYKSNASKQVEQLRFADETVLSLTEQNYVTKGTSGNNTLIGIGYSDDVSGLSMNDVIYGYAGADNINGMKGDDLIYGGEGNDTIDGYDDNDTIYGEDGNDVIDGGAGNDTLDGGIGEDEMDGEDGDDTLYGGLGEDELYGGAGNDEIYGDEDDDYLNGGDGADILDGGDGNDTIYGGNNNWNDILYGRAGDDNLYGQNSNDELYGGTGNDMLDGGSGNDLLRGEDGNDTILGGTGNDMIDGGSGNDTIDGGNGDDIIYGGSGDDSIVGGADEDVIHGEDGDDILDGGNADDVIYGGAGNDQLLGGGNWDELYGGDGDDILIGGDRDDILQGGAGNDTYVYTSGDDQDVITDENGMRDTISFTAGINPGNLTFTVDGDDLKIGFSGSSTKITLVDQFNSGDDRHIERVLFSDGSDLNLTLYANWILGNSSANTLTGTSGVNIIWGDAGNDAISGLAGDDELSGGNGDDTLHGGAGNDIIDGGAGTDVASYQTAAAGISVNLALGTASDDGDGGVDEIRNVEHVSGSDYADDIAGNAAANTLTGGAGNDVLYGDGGLDTLWGGTGADHFIFKSATAFSDTDVIEDFSAIDDDAINIVDLLIGYDPQQHAIDDFVTFTTSGSDTIMSVDRDGTAGGYSAQNVTTIKNVTGLDTTDMVTDGNLIVV